MTPIRVGVVGCGHFGRFHARKYQESADAELVAVVDRESAVARALAAELGVEAVDEADALIGRVDAASIAD